MSLRGDKLELYRTLLLGEEEIHRIHDTLSSVECFLTDDRLQRTVINQPTKAGISKTSRTTLKTTTTATDSVINSFYYIEIAPKATGIRFDHHDQVRIALCRHGPRTLCNTRLSRTAIVAQGTRRTASLSRETRGRPPEWTANARSRSLSSESIPRLTLTVRVRSEDRVNDDTHHEHERGNIETREDTNEPTEDAVNRVGGCVLGEEQDDPIQDHPSERDSERAGKRC